MKVGKKLVYWDTAVWLAWLMNERHWPETLLAGIEDVILHLENGKLQLLTSSITRSEVFEGRLTAEQKTLWNSIMRRSDVHAVAADDRVNDRAAAIREYHQHRGVKIQTPDAIHLATAVLYKADEFQTMDGLDKSGKPKRVLGLNGDVGGYPLFVTQPYPRSGPPTQTHLFLTSTLPSLPGVTDEKKEGERKTQNSAELRKDATGGTGNAAGEAKEAKEKDT